MVLVDVRPAAEYAAGHIAGAISIPHDKLEEHLGELPRDKEIVAYCRGPYSAAALNATSSLSQKPSSHSRTASIPRASTA